MTPPFHIPPRPLVVFRTYHSYLSQSHLHLFFSQPRGFSRPLPPKGD